MTMPELHPPGPLAALFARSEALRAVREWIADLMAERDEEDTSIAWEDGEEHAEDDVAA